MKRAVVSVELREDEVLVVTVEDETGVYCEWSMPYATVSEYKSVSRSLLATGQVLVLNRGNL